MSVEEVTKLIYAVGITGSIVGVSVALFRLLNAVTSNIEDFRKTVRNLGILTEGLVEDHQLIKDGIENFVEISNKFKNIARLISEKIVAPLTAIFAFLSTIQAISEKFTKKFNRSK